MVRVTVEALDVVVELGSSFEAHQAYVVAAVPGVLTVLHSVVGEAEANAGRCGWEREEWLEGERLCAVGWRE